MISGVAMIYCCDCFVLVSFRGDPNGGMDNEFLKRFNLSVNFQSKTYFNISILLIFLFKHYVENIDLQVAGGVDGIK